MTPAEKLELKIIEEMLQWEAEDLYNVFGPWLEVVVEDQKTKNRAKLKKIWKDRKLYKFCDTGDIISDDTGNIISDDTMLLYFDPKKIGKYTLHELELIIEKIENETILQTK